MPRSPRKLTAVSAVILSFLAVGHARAQTATTLAGIVPPRAVVLYVHAELKDTDFVEPLVCALRQVLTAGVDVKDISLPLDSALLATPTQFDVSKVSDQLARATVWDGGSLTYKYLLLPHDLKDQTYRYVFAMTFPRAHNGVVSLSHLYATNATCHATRAPC